MENNQLTEGARHDCQHKDFPTALVYIATTYQAVQR